MKQTWSEAYRPKTLEGYVFKNEAQKNQIKNMIDSGALNHMILTSNSPGTGKTTLALLMLNELNVPEGDILYINASVNNGIDYIRDKVVGFSETMPYGDMKYVVLDESDFLSPSSQGALRGIMQDDVDTVRFILTCNYINKIIEPLISRCPVLTIDRLDRNEFTARVAEILLTENISFEMDILDDYVNRTFPDMRKCINNMQLNSIDGVLNLANDDLQNNNEVFMDMTALFQAGKIKEARKFISQNIAVEQYVDAYRFLYDNVELFASGDDAENEAILIIKRGLVDHGSIGDPEICLSATIVQLSMVEST